MRGYMTPPLVCTLLLFQVPLGIVVGLLGLIPVLGSFIGAAAGIYEIVLSVFAVMGAHGLSGGKATAVVLIPAAVALLLVCAVIFIVVAAVANNPNLH